MVLRAAIIAALVAVSFGWGTQSAAAQAKGLERAAAVTARADVRAGWAHGRAHGRPEERPQGIRRRFRDWLPPGIRRVFVGRGEDSGGDSGTGGETGGGSDDGGTGGGTGSGTDGSTDTGGGSDSGGDGGTTCEPEIVIVDGMMMQRNCDGTLTPLLGGL